MTRHRLFKDKEGYNSPFSLNPFKENFQNTMYLLYSLTECFRQEIFINFFKKQNSSGSLQVCKFPIRNLSRHHFLEVFCRFQSTFTKLVRSSFLVALQNVNLQLLLKGDFSKFLEKPLFGTYHARVRFFRQSCKTQKFLLLYQNKIPPQTLSQQF